MQDTKLTKQKALHELSMEENWRTMTDEEVVDALLSTELSTYKQELIEWAESKRKKESQIQPASISWGIGHAKTVEIYNKAIDDLINHIKGEK